MADLLLVRPPLKSLLEQGPPADLREALASFEGRIADSEKTASEKRLEWKWHLPA